MNKVALFLNLICLVSLIGCGSTASFTVKVDSISATHANTKQTYMLFPARDEINKNDLQYKEYINYLNSALVENGFVNVKEPTQASLAIFVDYGIGEPKTNVHSYSLPIYGQTGVSSLNTTGSISPSGNVNLSTTPVATYGVTGSIPVTEKYDTYDRYFILDAINFSLLRQSGTQTQVWKVTTTSTGSSSDLRRVFPVMVAASQPYIGRNSGKQIKLNIDEDDPSILGLKANAADQ